MGHTASKPDPTAHVQVIGCGLSRTGTASFAKALEILLGGPVYHGGTQLIYAGETHMRSWIDIFRHTPIKTNQDRELVTRKIAGMLQHYTAVTDMPPILFTGELVELFPDAKVICTTRDPEKWWRSMEAVAAKSDNRQRQNDLIFTIVFALLPTLRYWNQLATSMRFGRFGELYYQSGHDTAHPGMYQEHLDYIKKVVPADRLHFFQVADGWEPLCQILGCEVPDIPFPRANDSEATERVVKGQLQRGLMAWAGLVGSVAVVVGVGVRLWKSHSI